MSIELKDDLPAMSPETAKKAMQTYQAICREMLDKSDFQDIGGKQFKKKSAWRKLARAFSISDEIIKEEKLESGSGPDKVTTYEFWVRAYTTVGRSAIGVGACSSSERKFAHPDHDIRGTAHTRAKNRAISDLIGSGEVSAEEIEDSKAYAEKVNAQAEKTFRRIV